MQKLTRTATGYAAIFHDLAYSPQKIDMMLFTPQPGQSLALAYEAVVKSEQSKSHRYGQPLLKMYKKKLERIMFENVPDQKRQASFLAEWRHRLREKTKSHAQKQCTDHLTENKASEKTIVPKTGRWEDCRAIDDFTAARLIRYFMDRFIANPQDKKMGEIACVLLILIYLAEEGLMGGMRSSKSL